MVLGVQAPIWYAIILVIIGDILMRHSRFFRQNYYIGGNEKSAKLSGIKVITIFERSLISCFTEKYPGAIQKSRQL